jgi:hypothetical protein
VSPFHFNFLVAFVANKNDSVKKRKKKMSQRVEGRRGEPEVGFQTFRVPHVSDEDRQLFKTFFVREGKNENNSVCVIVVTGRDHVGVKIPARVGLSPKKRKKKNSIICFKFFAFERTRETLIVRPLRSTV